MKVLPKEAERLDGRTNPHYSADFMAKKTMGMFFFRYGSVNSYIEADVVAGRMNDPTQRTIAYYLERSSVVALNHLLWKQFYIALRSKQLDSLKGMGGRFTLAIDGVSLSYSSRRHCDKCLVTHHDNGVIQYHHSLLVASIVDTIRNVSIVIAVIPIENTVPGAIKQDCEMNASKALLWHLKHLAPQMKFNISVDGLYLSSEFVTKAKQQGHEVTIPLAKENMVIFDVLKKDFKDRKITKQENRDSETTIEYGPENVAPFWGALHKSDTSIKIYGLNRKITSKKTGEIRECMVVSTIEPTDDKRAVAISDLQRERWQEENNTFNVFKNLHNLKHIFNHKAATQVFQFAAIAINMRNIYLLRHPPQKYVKKPLSITTLLKIISISCQAPMNIFSIERIAPTGS